MASPLYQLSAFKAGFALAQLLPRPVLHRIADGIGLWGLRRSEEFRRTLGGNLAVATGRSGDALDALVEENTQCFARMLADYFRFTGPRVVEAGRLVDGWDGWEHITAARERGRGTIIVTGHLGHWELGGLVLAMRSLPMTVVTLPEPTPGLMRWREACRRQLGIQTIEIGRAHV